MSTNVTSILGDDFSEQICATQDQYTASWHQGNQIGELAPLWLLIVQQHKYNFDLWHQEDLARIPNASDTAIASVKRKIDSLNQQRNDAIAELDIYLSEHSFTECSDSDRPWNSETVGSVVDRLSIASLKIYHMHEESLRANASPKHQQTCVTKLNLLNTQRNDLALALQALVNDINAGRKQHKIYHQFKMYNDPELNPAVYSSKN